MTNRFQTAIARHADRLQNFAAVTITYTTVLGVVVSNVPATIGKTEFLVQDATGAAVSVVSRDYIFSAAVLVDGDGNLIEPSAGDEIADGDYTYKATLFDPQTPVWKWSDTTRILRRVHTKEWEKPA